MWRTVIIGAFIGSSVGIGAGAVGVGYGALIAYIGAKFGFFGVFAMTAGLVGAAFGAAAATDKVLKS